MTDYRLFFIRDGHIRGAAELEAHGDVSAIAVADVLREGLEAELWNRTRRVHAFAVGRATEWRPGSRQAVGQ